jgi:hypothetical protein
VNFGNHYSLWIIVHHKLPSGLNRQACYNYKTPAATRNTDANLSKRMRNKLLLLCQTVRQPHPPNAEGMLANVYSYSPLYPHQPSCVQTFQKNELSKIIRIIDYTVTVFHPNSISIAIFVPSLCPVLVSLKAYCYYCLLLLHKHKLQLQWVSTKVASHPKIGQELVICYPLTIVYQ